MSENQLIVPVHPTGEQPLIELAAAAGPAILGTFAGPIRVEWDEASALTLLGQMPFFIGYLKVSGLSDAWVSDCPLEYTSPNAPEARDVLGTSMLSILSGHRRYAHITALRSDTLLPELLGMKKVLSEDSVRRAFKAIAEGSGGAWLQRHIGRCTYPLLCEPYIIDIDTTVKPLYGRQEGAVVSYNPKKPGRPSHVPAPHLYAGRASPRHGGLRRRPEMSIPGLIPRLVYGRCSTGWEAICGRAFCVAIPASDRRASCAKRSAGASIIS